MTEKSVLEKIRKEEMSRNSSMSELQLRQTNMAVKNCWDTIQALKKEANEARLAATKEINDKYDPLIVKAENQYAMMLKLARK